MVMCRRRRAALPSALAMLSLLGGCGDDPIEPPRTDMLVVELVADGLRDPTFLASPPGEPDRLFVIEREGTVRIIEDGAVQQDPYLDIRDKVATEPGERGLLGFAFHPDYQANGYIYLSYTDLEGNNHIERYTRLDREHGNPSSVKLILEVEQPNPFHNGGAVRFGQDGMLFFALGDGSAGLDPERNAQDTGTLLGSIMRIDVDGGDPYAIPSDNPFAGSTSSRGEIWHYGLRHPWRFVMDAPSGQMFIADVGEETWEELNVVSIQESGANFGWPIVEGLVCTGVEPCDSDIRETLTAPLLVYDHEKGEAIIGGDVYWGSSMPDLRGYYFFMDLFRPWIQAVRVEDGELVDEREWVLDGLEAPVVSFGRDGHGELYIMSQAGNVWRLTPGAES